jgi:hypothetical protein
LLSKQPTNGLRLLRIFIDPFHDGAGFGDIIKRSGTSDLYELSVRGLASNDRVWGGFTIRDFKVDDGHAVTVGFDLVFNFEL